MAIQVAINHRTDYGYGRPVTPSPHTVGLRPAHRCRATVCSDSLSTQPSTLFLNWQLDPHGHYPARTGFPEPTS